MGAAAAVAAAVVVEAATSVAGTAVYMPAVGEKLMVLLQHAVWRGQT